MVDFLVLGLQNSILYSNVVSLYVEDKICYGYNRVSDFIGVDKKFGNICWITNIMDDCSRLLVLKKDYNLDDYRRFDERRDCINIDRREDIPDGYYGLIGVPTTVMMYIDRNIFDILGVAHTGVQKYDLFIPYVDGIWKFPRWIIRRKKDG